MKLTSTTGGKEGWAAQVSGAEMAAVLSPTPHVKGTTVEVRDLFFNVPARRKFLRTERTEFLKVDEVVRKMSLSQTRVDFFLSHNGKQVRHYAGGEESQRVSSILGQAFLENSITFSDERNGMILRGWIGLPTYSRSQADQQFFFVSRIVRIVL